MVSHFNVVYYVELSATARKFKMGEGGVQIDWCQIKKYFAGFFFLHQSSIGATLAPMTSLPIQDGAPHDFRSKMAAPTTPRWRPPRNQDGGPL